LTVQTVERAGVVKDSKVFMTVLRAIGDSIFGVAAPRSRWTDKVPYTVGGQGVVIVVQVPFLGTPPFEFIVFDMAKSAKTPVFFWNSASVDTQRACNAVLGTRGIHWKSVGIPAIIVNPLDLRPDLIEMVADTISTKTNHIGDGFGVLTAVSACSHNKIYNS